MAHVIVNPTELHDPVRWGYSHTARVPADRDLVFVAGQYASSADGTVVSPAFAEQVHGALDNLAVALAAHDLTVADVVQLRMYVVDHDFAKLGTVVEAVTARWGQHPPTSTLLGVAALATPDISFEIEAVAARG